MHRLFTIDYLVYEICSHATDPELSVLARVSSIWFRCAIPHLYGRFLGMENALAPLGETVYKNDKSFIKKYVKIPGDEDFKRLWKYTPYVQTLRVDPSVVSIALHAMRRSASSGFLHLFPNVRHLYWDCPEYSNSTEWMDVSINLVTPKIDRLTLFIYDHSILHYLCLLVMTRVPALCFLIIHDETDISTAENLPESLLTKPMQGLLNFYTETLTTVELSLSLNSLSIVQCLSKMSNLRHLKIDVTYWIAEDEKMDNICGNDPGGGFVSLCYLWFDGSFQLFNNMFLKPHRLASLETLCTKFIPVDIGAFISSIVESCPHMRSLSVGIQCLYNTTHTWHVVPWPSVQPTSRLKDLSCLSLKGMRFSVTLEELTEFLKSRTTWTRLHILTAVPLRLQDMLLYAKHCPNLEHLGIYIDDISGFRIEDLPSGNDLPTFPVLTSIDFSSSEITYSTSRILAQFLYRTCKKPPGSHQLRGLCNNVTNDLLGRLAMLYIDEQSRIGSYMSSEVMAFVKMMVRNAMTISADG